MKVSLFLLLVAGALAHPGPLDRAADACDVEKCKLPDCRCSSTVIPGDLSREETPQLVLLTFDDAVTISNMDYYRSALFSRKNPNDCPISATFFVAHDYTNYSMIHELHSRGMEIGMHSITHEALTIYWKNATVETLRKEFAEQRDLVSKFAKIPTEDMKGIRMPFLQMAGNNQFTMLNDNGFLYDLSWPTQSFMRPGLWPYTTTYKSTQDCTIGPCPTESFSKIWVIPMINWADEQGVVCSMADACVNIPVAADDIKDWMIGEFNKQYNGNRAPFGVYIHAAWFNANPVNWEAYNKFLDYLQTLPDVYMSSASQVVNWMRNPKKLEDMTPENTECQATYNPTCIPKTCPLKKEGKEERWMTSCIADCPKSYPWLGNPLGNTEYP